MYCSRSCQGRAYRARQADRISALSAGEQVSAPAGSAARAAQVLAAVAGRVAAAVDAGMAPREADVRLLGESAAQLGTRAEAATGPAATRAVTSAPAKTPPTGETSREENQVVGSRTPVAAPRGRTRTPPQAGPRGGEAAGEGEDGVVRVVDLAEQVGPGWSLTQTADSWSGDWQVRLHGTVIGTVSRHRSLSGRGTTGWDATQAGLPITTGTNKNWPTRALAAAAVADAHQRATTARPRRRGRRT